MEVYIIIRWLVSCFELIYFVSVKCVVVEIVDDNCSIVFFVLRVL